MDEIRRHSDALTNRELAQVVFEAAYVLEMEQITDLPAGEARSVYPELFRAVAYSIEYYGYRRVTLKLDEIAAFSRSLAETERRKGWASAESVRQNFYKLTLPIRVELASKRITFNVELPPRRANFADRMEVSAEVFIPNLGTLEPIPNAMNAGFTGADLPRIHGELEIRFDDRAVLHAGRAAIAGVLAGETVPLIADYPYRFGRATEAVGVDWGSGSPVFYRARGAIVHTFRVGGIFRPQIIRKGRDAEPFPFEIEVMTRDDVSGRLRRAVKEERKARKR